MNKATDDDERRRRSLEAGREMLERYKAERINKVKGTGHGRTDEASDDESFCVDKSMGRGESYVHEGVSSRDMTQSSVSMSEGEADGDLEGLAGRVARLEEMLQGKEAIVEALHAEIDHLRAEASSPNSSQSQNSSIHGRDIISLYHTKLQEFEKAINKRDNLIEELTWSLQQALSARDNVVAQLNSLNAVQIPDRGRAGTVNSANMQDKIDALEVTLSDQRSIIETLNGQLMQIQDHARTLEMEMETRNDQISDYKTQINNLNEQIRLSAAEKNSNVPGPLELQKQYEARVDKIKQDTQHIFEKFTTETSANTARHQQELKEVVTKHETEITNIQDKYEERLKQMKDENKVLADRLNKELPDLETKHAKELSVFQAQMGHYKRTVEALKLELVNRSESQQTTQAELNRYKARANELKVESENGRRVQQLEHQKEKDMLGEQIKLHKLQLEEIMSKYVAATAILESKESIERSLEQALTNAATLKDENDSLKFKLDDLSSRYSAAQSLIENSQAHERTLGNRIFGLEKSLSRLSGINASTFSEMNETAYQSFDEVAIQYHLTKQKLEEKAELEKLLVGRIENLEDEVRKTKEELEEANLTKRSYEKQLKDMRNMCDKYMSELGSLRNHDSDGQSCLQSAADHQQNRLSIQSKRGGDSLDKTGEDRQEMKKLKITLEQREAELADSARKVQELLEKCEKSEEECRQLKNGLAAAWSQCAEVEEKLNQTLALNESRLDLSAAPPSLRMKFARTDSANDTRDQSTNTNGWPCEENNDSSDTVATSLRSKLASTFHENERLVKEVERLLEKQIDYDQVRDKAKHYFALADNLAVEKQRAETENEALRLQLKTVHSLKESANQLRAEKDSLRMEVSALICVHDEEISAIKAETASEIRKVQSLVLGVRDGSAELRDLKVELETRHAKEMEELRTYFEQKCLLMEKQYSEEIFSQQSKKMSDNDSEIADSTDGLYFGGAGDCTNASNLSERSSRVASPLADEQTKHNGNGCNKSELEITVKALQEELQNKIIETQEVKLHYEKALDEQRIKYERELHDNGELPEKLEAVRNMVTRHCQTEWDEGASLENGELIQLRAAYDHQLEEQIALAKLDIVNALQEQMQALLSIETDVEDIWSPELLELRDKLTGNAKREMQLLKDAHAAEVQRLEQEYSRNVARMMDRHREQLNQIQGDSDTCPKVSSRTADPDRVAEERNSLDRTCATLKTLVEELLKYFLVCEEEVNDTLIGQVFKRRSRDNVTGDVEESKEEEPDEKSGPSRSKMPRVRFAPRTTEILSIMNSDNETLRTMFEEKSSDIAEKLRQELNSCARRLKSESADILSAGVRNDGNPADCSAKEAVRTNRMNEQLTWKLREAESTILNYQEEMEQLKLTVLDLQRKLTNAESKKEEITEGYGENDEVGVEITLQDFSHLQEKARHVLSNGGGDCTVLLQLIEELCRQSDKLMEDARREKEDLQQQVPLEPTPPPYIHRVCCQKIEAADKQLKATRRFLDEQASEREVERDEAAKQIHVLQEQLKEREREKGRDLRITSEQSTLSPESTSEVPVLRTSGIDATVEALESQMREMSSLVSDTEAKKVETESELKAAVDKIWVLRDIITDLEQRLEVKSEKEESLRLQIGQLETVIAAQTKNQQELVQELDTVKTGAESKQLNERIHRLQEELRKHKLSSEQFNVNSTALKQIKSELREMQAQLDKRIKELESVHMCGSNSSLSQPSEDVSIREQIDATRCPTPDDDPASPPMLPLDQLLKLKEKMTKHARAEEVAFKRIKDLEMRVVALKNQNEELQAEQEILQQTTSEQLYQIEAMRGRLEQHKQNAPFAQRQATSRLELQLHEANAKFQSLECAIAEKELELRDTRSQLDRVNQLLQEKEAEIANVVRAERAGIQKVREHLEIVEEENRILQAKVGVQEHSQLELPRLIDGMLADKNEEIDHLKDQLAKKEKQLELYCSLNLDETQLRELIRQTEPKNSARTLSDILSIRSECEETNEAVRAVGCSAQMLPNVSTLKIPVAFSSAKIADDSSAMPLDVFATSISDNTATDKIALRVPPLDLGSRSHSLSAVSNRRSSEIDSLQHGEPFSGTTSEENDATTDEKEKDKEKEKEKEKGAGEESSVKESGRVDDESLVSAKHVQTSIDNGSIEEMEKLENQLETLRDELRTKSEILEKREADLLSLRRMYNELRTEAKEAVETLAREKRFYQEQYESSKASENKIKQDLLEVENVLKARTAEIREQKSRMRINEKIITELNSENGKLKEDMKEKEQEYANESETTRDGILRKDKRLRELEAKNELLEQEIVERRREIQRLTEGLIDRDRTIGRLEEMVGRIGCSGASSPSNEKDEEIRHLQEYLKEKDKVIRQMNDDSKSLHRALETIQNKMKESGNVVELRRKLKEEQKLNVESRNELDRLNKELSDLKLAAQKLAERSQDDTDIEDMVQRELNLSAHLDRRLMNAIESDQEDGVRGAENRVRSRERYPEGAVERSSELQLQLSQANRINDELKKLKDDLEIERGMLERQIAEYEDRVFQLQSDLAEERKKVAKLNEELFSEKDLIRSLKIQIEKEHRSMESGHAQDSELIEYLRDKLKTCLDNEAKLRNDLSLLRQEHESLEIQLSLTKEQRVQSQKSADELPKLADLLEAERKKYLSVMESFEKEERDNAELKDALRRLQTEKNRFEKQLEMEAEEKEKLISSLALVEGIKEHLQSDLNRAKEELKAREKESELLQKRIKTMSDMETRRQEQMSSEHNQLKGLRREINNAREVMVDLEADMKQSKRELAESLEREMKLSETVHILKVKETNLLKKLFIVKDEEKKLRETIAELQEELRSSAERELELNKESKSRYAVDKSTPTKLLQRIKDLSDTNKKYLNEKSMLQEKLVKALEDKEQLGRRVKLLESRVKRGIESHDANAAISEDYTDKLQHFYGNYMRADSRRRALTYQKRYLLTILGGYRISEESTLSVLARLTSEQRSYATIGRHKKSPRVRFKSAALVLVSIHRMKWLIERSFIGRKIGLETLLCNLDQPYVSVPKLAMNHSPPVRERPVPSEDGHFDGFALEQYYQRLRNIQQTLGLAMAESGSRQIHPE